jgi:cellobiose-specific phosphotransferase system component IIA
MTFENLCAAAREFARAHHVFSQLVEDEAYGPQLQQNHNQTRQAAWSV